MILYAPNTQKTGCTLSLIAGQFIRDMWIPVLQYSSFETIGTVRTHVMIAGQCIRDMWIPVF